MHTTPDATLPDPATTAFSARLAPRFLAEPIPDAVPDSCEVRKAHFTGSGQEYFRIWVVNLLLSLATLGIYSAWAKVRRLQYFDRNTQLAGACFDFRGDPKAVLRGRILAVVLLAAYQYAFGFSLAFGVGVAVFILLALPYLLRGALRFRLSNTQYRGLWLGFNGSVTQAYLAYAPPVATVLSPGLALALAPDQPALIAASMLPYLGWPLMHGYARSYQQRHILFGNRQSDYQVPPWRFFRPYLIAGTLALLLSFGIGLLAAFALAAVNGKDEGGMLANLTPFLITALILYVMYLLAGPYMQVRITNLAWSNTSFSGMRVRSTIPARGFMRLQAANALLTLITLGLYRPFAVVRAYQYRLAHTEFEIDADFDHAAEWRAQERRNAAGDGVADGLGIDLSW